MIKKIIILVVVFCGSIVVYGQKSEKKPPGYQTEEQLAIERKNHNCIARKNKTFSQRIKNYPFGDASYIELVSFLNKNDTTQPENQNRFESLPKLNDTICYSKLFEIKRISIAEIDSLTDIFYNVGFKGPTLLIEEIKCYEPRNAILFFDKRGKIFEYIEICFDCERIIASDDKINIGDICKQKFSLIKNFFRKCGIVYGTQNL